MRRLPLRFKPKKAPPLPGSDCSKGAHDNKCYLEFKFELGHDHEVKECKNCGRKVEFPCWRCQEEEKARTGKSAGHAQYRNYPNKV